MRKRFHCFESKSLVKTSPLPFCRMHVRTMYGGFKISVDLMQSFISSEANFEPKIKRLIKHLCYGQTGLLYNLAVSFKLCICPVIEACFLLFCWWWQPH